MIRTDRRPAVALAPALALAAGGAQAQGTASAAAPTATVADERAATGREVVAMGI
jgi:hypothetical protein